jgi:hypothetical protein
MTVSSMATGCDVSESDVTGSDITGIIGFSFITLWVLLLLWLRRHISICKRRRRRCISLCQRRRLRIALAGPTGSGQSMFVRWFVHNMTPKPDRILRCYGEYQTLYETVKGIEFQQGLPDLDNLDPREKHFFVMMCLRIHVSSFVNIIYHCRAFSSAERPYYSLRVSCKSDKKRDVTSFLWLDIRFLFFTVSLNAHYMVLFQNLRRIADHGASTPNVSLENRIFPGSFCPSYSQTSWLSVRSLSSVWERTTFSSVLSIRPYFSWVFPSAV